MPFWSRRPPEQADRRIELARRKLHELTDLLDKKLDEAEDSTEETLRAVIDARRDSH